MEPKKIVRIVAVFMAVAALAVWIAAELLFPDANRYVRILPLILVIYGLGRLWVVTRRQKQTQLPK